MNDGIKVLGSLDGDKREVAEYLIQDFTSSFPHIAGEMYLGYPIYIDEVSNARICVDIALISKIGVYIINILKTPVTDYGLIQDTIASKVESKFSRQPFLYRKRKLVFEFIPITYCEEHMDKQEDYILACSHEELIDAIIKNKRSEEFEEDLYVKIISGLQEAYGINNHVRREGVSPGTKAFAIDQMATLVEKYGNSQMEAILSDTEGIQRIRGMAGSGKTVVLARKAVELHTAHPDWDIVVTYSTRSLKEQLKTLISRFYSMKNDGALYDDKKLRIMHAWGSSKSHGVYYETCLAHHITPLSLNDAKLKYGYGVNYFSKLCGELLKEIHTYRKMYDCILIDEAQDFDKNFLQLCSFIIGNSRRLVYAYDELQSLNEDQMPSPQEIFGNDVEYDTPLTVCYRNQGPVIVTAHAIGMGLYRKEGLVQLPGSADVWNAIGYESDNTIKEGEEVILYRTKETSPDFLNVDKNELIRFSMFEDKQSMYESLIKTIYKDTTSEQLLFKDIMIIDMDTLTYSSNCNYLISYINTLNEERVSNGKKPYDLHIHTAGANNPEDFFREKSIVYSSVRRAKGNESYMVYIVNAQKCVNSLQRRSDRNALFTAITRSKGWVRALGYGTDMKSLCKEFDLIKANDYKLHFNKYPTKEEQERIFLNNKDIEDKDVKTIDQTKALIDRLSNEESISKVQLLKQLFGDDTEELLRLLKEAKNES